MSTDAAATLRYAGMISRFAAARILVIGDLMLDEFIWGKVSRISPEAPVPVVNVTGESYYSRRRGECGAQSSGIYHPHGAHGTGRNG